MRVGGHGSKQPVIRENEMSLDNLKHLMDQLRRIAIECDSKGPGYAQEGVVLREAKQRLSPKSLAEQQQILEAWQRLFVEGELSWGYNLDNPGSPFFHSVTQKAAAEVGVR